jgi:phosphoserine phosphatase
MNNVLSSWQDTPTKEAILKFVSTVTDDNNPLYVPPEERVATFDNDGTLWCEKPAYIQLFFAIERLRQMVEQDPKLIENPAYKAAINDDLGYFGRLYPGDLPTLMQLIYDSHAGMSQHEFEQLAYNFLTGKNHPRFNIPYKNCVYQPMVELLSYLQTNKFKVFIASAGGMSFMRTVSEEVYGVSRENVIGSNISFEYQQTTEGPVLLRKPGLIEPPDDGPGKPVNIELHVGRPPILASGNANGDIEMLEYTAAENANRGRTFLNLLIRHDDAEREYAYDSGAENVQKIAREQGWAIVSMKEDFSRIFP